MVAKGAAINFRINMKTVKKYNNSFDADLAKGILENNGINACVLHATMNSVFNIMQIPVELAVDDADYEKAIEILEQDQPEPTEDVLPEE